MLCLPLLSEATHIASRCGFCNGLCLGLSLSPAWEGICSVQRVVLQTRGFLNWLAMTLWGIYLSSFQDPTSANDASWCFSSETPWCNVVQPWPNLTKLIWTLFFKVTYPISPWNPLEMLSKKVGHQLSPPQCEGRPAPVNFALLCWVALLCSPLRLARSAALPVPGFQPFLVALALLAPSRPALRQALAVAACKRNDGARECARTNEPEQRTSHLVSSNLAYLQSALF